ncbi:hypothetical protein K438DRAFT_1970910 [Mycena galopus ATCC 62051]|nr:hypothetical protein K438DRAFT_1970910 [Mycena galopus ATCC 62051]
MPRVPNELIQAIVREVRDVPSLKSCSLAGSPLRAPCQRILLHSLELKVDRLGHPNYTTVHLFLCESPHVAEYITKLALRLPTANTPNSEVESFLQILGQLRNVKWCPIITMGQFNYDWTDLEARVASAVLEFLSRQPLRELALHSIPNIPTSAFLSLLTTAPKISMVFVSCWGDQNNSPAMTPHRSTLTSLSIRTQPGSVLALLTRPQHLCHTKHLRELELSVKGIEYVHSHALLCSAAQQLESIIFHCESLGPAVRTPPSLPALREIEFTMTTSAFNGPWFKDTILTILGPKCSPALTSITITLANVCHNQPPHAVLLETGLMSALEDALIGHTAKPSIRWRVSLQSMLHARPTGFPDMYIIGSAALPGFVRENMGRLDQKGRVFVGYW